MSICRTINLAVGRVLLDFMMSVCFRYSAYSLFLTASRILTTFCSVLSDLIWEAHMGRLIDTFPGFFRDKIRTRQIFLLEVPCSELASCWKSGNLKQSCSHSRNSSVHGTFFHKLLLEKRAAETKLIGHMNYPNRLQMAHEPEAKPFWTVFLMQKEVLIFSFGHGKMNWGEGLVYCVIAALCFSAFSPVFLFD